MKTVLVFGTFDLLHPGHKYFLKQAKKLGNFLIVVVAREQTVKKIKGFKPTQTERERKNNLKKNNYVDRVVMGNLKNPYYIIKKIKPDIIALGYDQNSFTANLPQALKTLQLTPKIIRLKPFFPDRFKTSIIKNT